MRGAESSILEFAGPAFASAYEAVTLHAGQSFYEGPNDVHIVGRNASTTRAAKFVVFLVKNKGAPILTPVR